VGWWRRGGGGIVGVATGLVGAVGGAVVVTAVGGDGCRARSRAKVGRAVVMAGAKSGAVGGREPREDRQEQPGHQRV
jgi:hypothetical protein